MRYLVSFLLLVHVFGIEGQENPCTDCLHHQLAGCPKLDKPCHFGSGIDNCNECCPVCLQAPGEICQGHDPDGPAWRFDKGECGGQLTCYKIDDPNVVAGDGEAGVCRPTDISECAKEPEGGFCRAHFINWHYDVESKECKTFAYGGCGGNGNNFGTKEGCEAICGGY